MNSPEPTNIDCFEQAAAALLARLFENFPRPISVFSDKLENELVAGNFIIPSCVWPPRPQAPNENLTGTTLLWLCEEGLVRFKSENAYRFTGVVLTAKGYRAMNSPILQSHSSETYGQRIVKSASGAAVSGIINGLIRVAFEGINP